jgi:hypothetical protein
MVFDNVYKLVLLLLTAFGLTPGGSSAVHIRLTPGGSSAVHIYTQTVHRTTKNNLFTPVVLEPRSLGCFGSSSAVPTDPFRIPTLILVVTDCGNVPSGLVSEKLASRLSHIGITWIIALAVGGGRGCVYRIDHGVLELWFTKESKLETGGELFEPVLNIHTPLSHSHPVFFVCLPLSNSAVKRKLFLGIKNTWAALPLPPPPSKLRHCCYT